MIYPTEVPKHRYPGLCVCALVRRCVRNSPPLDNLYKLIQIVFHFRFETIFYFSDPVFCEIGCAYLRVCPVFYLHYGDLMSGPTLT